MSTVTSKIYAFTPAIEAKAVAALKSGGVEFNAADTTGQITYHGVTLGYSINRPQSMISVTVLKKPLVMPAGIIFDHLDTVFGTAK